MRLNRELQSRTTWTLRVVGWTVALLIIFGLMYKVMFNKRVESAANCLEQTASAERTATPLASVEKYATCIAGKSPAESASTPARCKYAGEWTSTRGDMVYKVTLEADGKFVAEGLENASADAPEITGAWTVAGRSLVWAYDSGAVWPPDINPIVAESADSFTLLEVDGARTRYALKQRHTSGICRK